MKNLSLQEQLLKAGLSNETKAKQIKTEKRKQNKKTGKSKSATQDNVSKQLAMQTKAEQAEKDKQLNKQRDQILEQKQIHNQVLQLIEAHQLPQDNENGIAYHFTDQNKVKVIYLDATVRNKVINGQAGIVKTDKHYHVVPVDTAEKIKQRDANALIILFSEATEQIDNNYQGYEIPDDLMW